MKKMTVWIAILSMLLGLTACGPNSHSEHLSRDYDRAGRRHI